MINHCEIHFQFTLLLILNKDKRTHITISKIFAKIAHTNRFTPTLLSLHYTLTVLKTPRHPIHTPHSIYSPNACISKFSPRGEISASSKTLQNPHHGKHGLSLNALYQRPICGALLHPSAPLLRRKNTSAHSQTYTSLRTRFWKSLRAGQTNAPFMGFPKNLVVCVSDRRHAS